MDHIPSLSSLAKCSRMTATSIYARLESENFDDDLHGSFVKRQCVRKGRRGGNGKNVSLTVLDQEKTRVAVGGHYGDGGDGVASGLPVGERACAGGIHHRDAWVMKA